MHAIDQGQIANSAPMAALNFSTAMNGMEGLMGASDGLGFDWGALFKLAAPITQAVGSRIQQPGTTIQQTPTGSLVTRQETGYPILAGGVGGAMDTNTLVLLGFGALALVMVMMNRR